MKKYKRRLPYVALKKVAAVAWCALIIILLIVLIFTGTNYDVLSALVAVILAAFLNYLVMVLADSGQYGYTDKYINVIYLWFLYRKICYSRFDFVVISNAAYNNGMGPTPLPVPIQYTVKGENGNIKVTFPFISLHKSHYPINKVKAGWFSYDLYGFSAGDDIYCLGICWFDSLRELLKHTDYPIYVLEDVYLRYKGMFEEIFSAYKETERFYIIADHSIPYNEYIGKKSN